MPSGLAWSECWPFPFLTPASGLPLTREDVGSSLVVVGRYLGVGYGCSMETGQAFMLTKTLPRAGKMAQKVKSLAAKPEDPSSVPR